MRILFFALATLSFVPLAQADHCADVRRVRALARAQGLDGDNLAQLESRVCAGSVSATTSTSSTTSATPSPAANPPAVNGWDAQDAARAEQARRRAPSAGEGSTESSPVFANTESPSPPTGETSQACRAFRIFEGLFGLSSQGEATHLRELRTARALACSGREPPTNWANGRPVRSPQGHWYYPGGAVARTPLNSWHYPSGSLARASNGIWYYSHGRVARSANGQTYYGLRGERHERESLISTECTRLGRSQCAAVVARETTDAMQMIAIMKLAKLPTPPPTR